MSAQTTQTRPSILLVDDEPGSLQILTSTLSGPDYQLICATKPSDAIKLASERNPHLVLLDVMMPDMDGFAVCHHLHEAPATKSCDYFPFQPAGSTRPHPRHRAGRRRFHHQTV